MAGKSLQEKREYIWEYYKEYIIAGIVVLFLLISTIVQILTQKDTYLSAVLINASNTNPNNTLTTEYLEACGVNPNRYEVTFDLSLAMTLNDMMDEVTYSSLQTFDVRMAAKEVDLVISDCAVFEYYAYKDYLNDLHLYFSEKQLQYLEPYLYYVDRSLFEADSFMLSSYPNPSDPNSMIDPIPIGIDLSKASLFSQHYKFHGNSAPIAGIACTSDRGTTAADFIAFLFQYSNAF